VLAAFLTLSLTACDVPSRLRYYFDPPESGEILFADDFSTAGSWDTWNDSLSIVNQNSGGLRFFVNIPDYDYWSRPKVDFQNVIIEVDAVKVSGPANNNFGVICRYENRDNFYYFLISSDGYYGILKVKDAEHTIISHRELQYSDVILKENSEINHMRVECIDSNLVLFVNDQKLAVASDSEFDWGGAGLMVGSYDQPGVDILFDNFIVIQP
jgi:hypothetical protein